MHTVGCRICRAVSVIMSSVIFLTGLMEIKTERNPSDHLNMEEIVHVPQFFVPIDSLFANLNLHFDPSFHLLLVRPAKRWKGRKLHIDFQHGKIKLLLSSFEFQAQLWKN